MFKLLQAIKAAKAANQHINTFAARQAKCLRSLIFKLWRKVIIKPAYNQLIIKTKGFQFEAVCDCILDFGYIKEVVKRGELVTNFFVEFVRLNNFKVVVL